MARNRQKDNLDGTGGDEAAKKLAAELTAAKKELDELKNAPDRPVKLQLFGVGNDQFIRDQRGDTHMETVVRLFNARNDDCAGTVVLVGSHPFRSTSNSDGDQEGQRHTFMIHPDDLTTVMIVSSNPSWLVIDAQVLGVDIQKKKAIQVPPARPCKPAKREG